MNEISSPDRSLAGLFSGLTRETIHLVRQEIMLAKSELAEKAEKAGWGIAAIGAGAGLLVVALQAFAAAAILGLAKVVDNWLAALIVAVVLALVGAVVLFRGLANLKRESLKPKQTLDSLRENTRWAKEQMS